MDVACTGATSTSAKGTITTCSRNYSLRCLIVLRRTTTSSTSTQWLYVALPYCSCGPRRSPPFRCTELHAHPLNPSGDMIRLTFTIATRTRSTPTRTSTLFPRPLSSSWALLTFTLASSPTGLSVLEVQRILRRLLRSWVRDSERMVALLTFRNAVRPFPYILSFAFLRRVRYTALSGADCDIPRLVPEIGWYRRSVPMLLPEALAGIHAIYLNPEPVLFGANSGSVNDFIPGPGLLPTNASNVQGLGCFLYNALYADFFGKSAHVIYFCFCLGLIESMMQTVRCP